MRGLQRACCRCRKRRRSGDLTRHKADSLDSEGKHEDSDAESIHEGEGYCQMSRVIIAGKGPVVKEEACGRLATGLCAKLNDDVKRPDVAGFEDDDGVVMDPWV